MQTVAANGARIPALGYGSYGMSSAQMEHMVPHALKAGFRHIDTAQIYSNESGMTVTAYCAMAIGRVFADPVLVDIAARYRRPVSQVVLRWLIQQDGVIALSRTVDESRVAQNAQIFDFQLTQQDMAAVQALATPGSRIVSPAGLAPAWDPTD